MASADSNKRLKAASGAPISAASSPSPAASLPAYQPPAGIVARNGNSPSRPSASIARPANGKTSLRLTVKAPPSKLRQATSGARLASNPYADTPSESDTTPAPRTARSTRNPRTVVEPDSDDLDEDMEDAEGEGDEEDEELDEDAEGEMDDDAQEDEESGDEDAEGEDEDLDDEMQDDEHPPPPVIRQERPPGQAKPSVTVTAPVEGPLKSVEDKEMEDDDDEEELSELDSNEGEGEGEGEEEDDEDDDGSGEDDDNSRSATPDLTKLTKRQRAAYQDPDGALMALSNEAQKKKHLTAEEHAMRRAEMARRRKNLSEKRNEEEKMDTINKLLKKPAPKRRTRAEILAANAADGSPGAEDGEDEKPDGLYVRWVHTREGSRIGVPEEWIEAPVGDLFRKPSGSTGGVMVEEVA